MTGNERSRTHVIRVQVKGLGKVEGGEKTMKGSRKGAFKYWKAEEELQVLYVS